MRAVNLAVVDRACAVVLTAGALLDVATEPHRSLGPFAIVALVALTGSVAWRRASPRVTTLVAVTGLIVFVAESRYSGDGSFQAAAVALNFYTLGRDSKTGDGALVSAVLLGYWLVGTVVITYVPPGGSVGTVLGAWILFGPLPFGVGRTLATRSELTRELAANVGRLREEQEARSLSAASEERNRMARELHDVIAHGVSVMVVQASAARRVAAGQADAAREALAAVESAGREALVELRRLVGVVRRSSGSLADSESPGLSQLAALVERSRAAGLPVELRLADLPTLSPSLDLVAYRVVQEALTNAIKHAGPARAEVCVSVADRMLELAVSDSGRGAAAIAADGTSSGHGLIGMGERVRLYGGELRAGPRETGGFEVSARIPFDGLDAAREAQVPRATHNSAADENDDGRLRWPWLDPALAGMLFAVLEVAVLSARHRHGPLAANMIVVGAIALVAVWRRRSPLLFLVAVGLLGSLMNGYLVALKDSPLLGIYFVLVPTYTVGAWADRRNALLGLAFFLGGAALNSLASPHGSVGDFAGAAFVFGAAWAAGRAIRARRLLTSELERTTLRVAIEREDRTRLAIAAERSRIARDLHAAVARLVAAMVVQAEAARSLLGRDEVAADAAMAAIESAGREALAELRRILGVLRHGEERGALAPQPGVEEIYTLIERAREQGQAVELTVDGDPGTLPSGVELGLYRILEDALRIAPRQRDGVIAVTLQFGEEALELQLSANGHGPNAWPTSVMRERVALCGGEVVSDLKLRAAGNREGWQFGARMPRLMQGVLA
jgi:signal transduction histidine kinase